MKCDELNTFKEQHNIKVQGEKNTAADQEETKEETTTSGILVEQTEK